MKIPLAIVNTKLWEEYEYPNKYGVLSPWYRTNIGKVKLSYSLAEQAMYIKGRIIDLLTKNNYINFDDLNNVKSNIDCFLTRANLLIRLKLNNFKFNLLETKVIQLEYSYNVNIENKDKYIEFLNYLYIENQDGKFRNYRNFTVEQFKKLNSSFYLKTKGDYKDVSLENFCLTLYNKSDQMTDKRDNNLEKFHKSNIKPDEIEAAKNIVRIECKVGYEYLKSICKKHGIQPTFENLFNDEISKEAIFHQIERFFSTGDFYSKKAAEKIINNNNLKINLDTPLSELSEYKYKKRKALLVKLGICPYGFIPEEWKIEKMYNPIKLILNKNTIIN